MKYCFISKFSIKQRAVLLLALIFIAAALGLVNVSAQSQPYALQNNVAWAVQIGGSGSDMGERIVVSPTDGSIFAIGRVGGPAGFDPSNTTARVSATDSSMFLAKYSSSSALMWVKIVANADPQDVVISADGSTVLVTGSFTGTSIFVGMSVVSTGAADLFVAKFSASTGAVSWVKTYGTSNVNSEFGQAVAVASDGSIFVAASTGCYYTNTLFYTARQTCYDYNSIMLFKYDTNGNLLWSKNWGTGNTQKAGFGAMALQQSSSSLFLAGGYAGSLNFGSSAFTITSSGYIDIFVVKVSLTDGSTQWVQSAGGSSNDDHAFDLAVATDGVYVTGYYYSTAKFDTTTLYSTGYGTNMFLAKYALDTGKLSWAQASGGYNYEQGNSVKLANDGTGVFVFGNMMYASSFGNYQNLWAWNNLFLAKYSTSGVVTWAKSVTVNAFTSYVYAGGMAIASDNSVYMIGFADVSLTLGTANTPVQYQNRGSNDVFLTKFSPCQSCSKLGTYNPDGCAATSSQCLSCPANTFGNVTGLTSCYGCPLGYASPAGSTAASACTLILCRTGQYVDNISRSCQNCTTGQYLNVTTALHTLTQCSVCANNTYQDKTAQASCLPCAATKVSNSMASYCFYAQPRNITISNIGHTIFTVSWNAPVGWTGQTPDASSVRYTLFIRNSTTSPWTSYKTITDGSINSYQFVSMNVNSSYQVAVQAFDSVDAKASSSLAVSPLFYTRDYSPPVAISDLGFVHRLYKYIITATFTPITDIELGGGSPVKYPGTILVFDADGNALAWPGRTQNYLNNLAVYNLEPNTTYQIAIIMHNQAGLSSTMSNLFVATTLPIDPVDAQSIAFPSVNTTSLTISFAVQQDATHYVLYARESVSGKESNWTISAATLTAMSVQIEGKNLLPSHRYSISLEVYENQYHSVRSDDVSIVMKPEAPVVSLLSQSNETLVAVLSSPSPIGSDVTANYTLFYKKKVDVVASMVQVEVLQQLAIISALNPGTRYLLTAQASVSDSYAQRTSDASTDIEVCTAANAVDGLVIVEFGEAWAHVGWTAPSVHLDAPAESYLLTLDGNTDNLLGTSDTQYVVTGLGSSETHSVDIQVVNCDGSVRSSVSTISFVTKPMPPTGLVAVGNTTTSITLSWAGPSVGNVEIASYTIWYATVAGNDSSLSAQPKQITNQTVPSIMLQNLLPGTLYAIKVSATNVAGLESNYTETIRVMTALQSVPSVPRSVSVGNIRATNFTVQWQLPEFDGNSPILRFEVSVVESESNKAAFAGSTTTGSDISFAVTSGIVENTTYVVTVFAVNSVGRSSPSESVTVRTLVMTRQEPVTPITSAPSATGAIVGGVVGGVAALVLVIVLILAAALVLVLVVRKLRRPEPKSTTTTSSSSFELEVI